MLRVYSLLMIRHALLRSLAPRSPANRDYNLVVGRAARHVDLSRPGWSMGTQPEHTGRQSDRETAGVVADQRDLGHRCGPGDDHDVGMWDGLPA